VLIGGSADVAFRRAARWDGWTMGGGAPDDFAAGLEKLRAAWREQGREGEPRTLALCYYALGDDAQGKAGAYLNHYYAYLGEHAEAVAQSAATDAETCAEYARGFEAAGADELIFFPSSPELEQVDLLADAVL
jgi:alkanesulfonate monooxygenase SsuD/methylene tetrahydromethanopterin reductase-like flavin-dependent oxidoreductase (luciferase family)